MSKLIFILSKQRFYTKELTARRTLRARLVNDNAKSPMNTSAWAGVGFDCARGGPVTRGTADGLRQAVPGSRGPADARMTADEILRRRHLDP